MSKKIEVTVYRRTFTTYEVEVADDFDVNAEGAEHALEESWFGAGGWHWMVINEDVDQWEIDSIFSDEGINR